MLIIEIAQYRKIFSHFHHRYPIEELAQYEFSKVAIIFSINN